MKLIFATTVFAMMAATVEAEVIHQQNFNSNMNGWTYKDNTHYVSFLFCDSEWQEHASIHSSRLCI